MEHKIKELKNQEVSLTGLTGTKRHDAKIKNDKIDIKINKLKNRNKLIDDLFKGIGRKYHTRKATVIDKVIKKMVNDLNN